MTEVNGNTVVDGLPGFRRRFRVVPGPNAVSSAVEDDFHCMAVTLHHDGTTVTRVEADLVRAPWTTCPGAPAQLVDTFTGVALADVPSRGEKLANCTHLHDLATLAAAHAFDTAPLEYDVLVCDVVDGRRKAELRRNGQTELWWVERKFAIVEPPEMAGMTLDKLRPWLEGLDAGAQEAARILRWANMIANGRNIPMERQSNASDMPTGNCYTFQAERKAVAVRIGEIREFTGGSGAPLDGRSSRLPR